MPEQPPARRDSDDGLSARSGVGSRRTAATLDEAQLQVGAFVRTTRQSQNLTQAQVAERTKGSPWQLSRAAVSAIERGQNFPGLEAMLALSNVLQIDPKELIERARLTVVPLDLAGRSLEELEKQASELFWAGDFNRALAIYDAMFERMARETPEESGQVAVRMAGLEIRRATALKRAGALLSAISSAERALILAKDDAETLAEAYVVLGDLQVHRGHLPLASDAARRAIDLSEGISPRTQGWAWMVQGRVHYLAQEFAQARRAFLKARDFVTRAGDDQHLTHIEGNIGLSWIAEGQLDEGRAALERAVDLARRGKQPILEASFSIELGKLALEAERLDAARDLAENAMKIARPRGHSLTIFRAQWLLHKLARRMETGAPDRERLDRLAAMYLELEQHEGIEEIREYREMIESSGGGRR